MLQDPPIPLATIQPLLDVFEFKHTHVPAEWEDIGGPENGPHVVGHAEFDLWTKDDIEIIVVDGMVVEVGRTPPDPEGFPF